MLVLKLFDLSCVHHGVKGSFFPRNIPEYWNKSVITLVLLTLLGKQNKVVQISFDKKPIPAIDRKAMVSHFKFCHIKLKNHA